MTNEGGIADAIAAYARMSVYLSAAITLFVALASQSAAATAGCSLEVFSPPPPVIRAARLVRANCRTANVPVPGMRQAPSLAFSGGSVMGMAVVGLA